MNDVEQINTSSATRNASAVEISQYQHDIVKQIGTSLRMCSILADTEVCSTGGVHYETICILSIGFFDNVEFTFA